jgi:hypothetical protein
MALAQRQPRRPRSRRRTPGFAGLGLSGGTVARHRHRSAGGTSASTPSTWRPQPLNDGLPQTLQVMRRHMVGA